MEPKKNPKFDLTRRSSLFFNIGLVLTLILVTTAFEWKWYDEVVVTDAFNNSDFDEEEIIPITVQPPPPPPKDIPKQPEIIEVPDEEEIEEPPPLEDMSEVNEETVVAPPPPPVTAPVKEDVDQIFDIVEEEATPVGGMAAYYKFLSDNLEYPRQAQRLNIEGTVYVRFVVDRDGTVSSAEVLPGRELGYGLDEEAIRVIKMSKWNPGKQRGRAVRVRKVLPVKFKLAR
jgi:protein TonB